MRTPTPVILPEMPSGQRLSELDEEWEANRETAHGGVAPTRAVLSPFFHFASASPERDRPFIQYLSRRLENQRLTRGSLMKESFMIVIRRFMSTCNIRCSSLSWWDYIGEPPSLRISFESPPAANDSPCQPTSWKRLPAYFSLMFWRKLRTDVAKRMCAATVLFIDNLLFVNLAPFNSRNIYHHHRRSRL